MDLDDRGAAARDDLGSHVVDRLGSEVRIWTAVPYLSSTGPERLAVFHIRTRAPARSAERATRDCGLARPRRREPEQPDIVRSGRGRHGVLLRSDLQQLAPLLGIPDALQLTPVALAPDAHRGARIL